MNQQRRELKEEALRMAASLLIKKYFSSKAILIIAVILIAFILLISLFTFSIQTASSVNQSYLHYVYETTGSDEPVSREESYSYLIDLLSSQESISFLSMSSVSREGWINYIEYEKNLLKDIEFVVKETEKITDTYTEPGKVDKQVTNAYNHNYTLELKNAAWPYITPWQVYVGINEVMGKEYSEDLFEELKKHFEANFYGLLKESEYTPVDFDRIYDVDSFNFYKTVTVTTTIEKTYYVPDYYWGKTGRTIPVPKKDKSGKPILDENGNPVMEYQPEYDWIPYERGPYTHTRTIVSEIKYPLPYFKQISSVFLTSYFDYRIKETTEKTESINGDTKTTIVKKISQPELINTRQVDFGTKLINGLKSLGIHEEDIDYFFEILKEYPYGESIQMTYGNGAGTSPLDMYYSGYGDYYLTENAIFLWPVDAPVKVYSGFGMRLHPILRTYRMHKGIDIDGSLGDSIFAAADGTVSHTGYDGDGYGNYVFITHSSGLQTVYAHLNSFSVSVGQRVSKGAKIGECGSTGLSTGPHLHFEVRENGNPVDPAPFLGLSRGVPSVSNSDLFYSNYDTSLLREYLRKKQSKLAEEPYFTAIINACKSNNVSPLLMFAITGAEVNYAKDNPEYWAYLYGEDVLLSRVKNIMPRGNVTDSVSLIANNPFNVGGGWWNYNTNIQESSDIACKTVYDLIRSYDKSVHPIEWINIRGGKGGYSTDRNWWLSVTSMYLDILKLYR